MSETDPGQSKAKPKARRTRRRSFGLRVRDRVRREMDRVLGADVGWSLAFVAVTLLLLGNQHCGGELGRLTLGETAARDILAPEEIHVVDRELTEARRAEARDGVPQVYVYDAGRDKALAADLASLFELGRQSLQEGRVADPALEQRIPRRAREVLRERGYDPQLEQQLIGALREVMSGPVVGNRTLLEGEERILLVELPARRETTLEDYEGIADLAAARRSLRERVGAALTLPPSQEETLAAFVASFLDANVYVDTEAGRQRREAAAAAVPPVLVRLSRGHVLIRKGERITSAALERLEAARGASSVTLGARELTGLVFVVSMLAFFLYRYSLYHQRHFRKLAHLHALLVLMLLSMMLLTRAMLWLAGNVVDSVVDPFANLAAYPYLVPLGAGSILVSLLANGRIATVYSAFAALLFGALNGWDFDLTAWATLVQLSGVYTISAYRERAALLRGGLVVGGAGAVAALALASLGGGSEPLRLSLYSAGLAFVGGAVGVGLLVSFSLPPLEGLFRVLTDIRLLELSNVNNPLLSQLAVGAPGSYNHSLVVGSLAEEAARSIGANSLFCRVAAFYHDIGKINHAEYFVENQRGVNPHDRLTPSMSALIIASHVKDGIKMAREAGLPEQIIDMIPQHHGTKLMTYFYEKAKSNADPSLGPVKEEDFRYPGPKPQTREAAVFMLADAVEAAARTVDDPTPNRLREMIRKVTNSVVLDGQLEECDLTFADLDRIQTAFHRRLVSIHHQRVDYPGFDFRRPKSDAMPSADSTDRRVARSS